METQQTSETEPVQKKPRIEEEKAALRVVEQPRGRRLDFAKLPEELQGVDFSRRISWGKFFPYPPSPFNSNHPSASLTTDPNDDDNKEQQHGGGGSPPTTIPTVATDTPPVFHTQESPALCHHINAMSGRARACTIHLKPQKGQLKSNNHPRPIPTPIFMPVGTKGCLKSLVTEEFMTDPALSCPIILANTYHMALQPGTKLLDRFGGLFCFMGQNNNGNNKDDDNDNNNNGLNFNLLTDSGGFQMVSLAKLSQVTEEGVTFENPFLQGDPTTTTSSSNNKRDLSSTTTCSSDNCLQENNNNDAMASKDNTPATTTTTTKISNGSNSSKMMLLKPEDSIRFQNEIGANIIMALDDVVSSVEVDDDRFEMATYRTLRWYDRCIQAHTKADTQSLFPIVQGGLDTSLGGLRERCLAGFRRREVDLGYVVPGYAIGGLAGGEEKDDFWRVVDQCCRALPDNKPRYLMGVGYPLDLVVCTALGVDMYDCVFPTRTARFGVALVPGETPGSLRLKSHEFATDSSVIQDGCQCQACHGEKTSVPRSRIHRLLKTDNPLAIQLLTQHNIAYMMALVRNMRQAILDDQFATFAQNFVNDQFRGARNGGKDIPTWVRDALAAAGIVFPVTTNS